MLNDLSSAAAFCPTWQGSVQELSSSIGIANSPDVTPRIPVSKAILHLKRPNADRGIIAGRYELSGSVSLASSNKSVYSFSRNSLEKAGPIAILSGLLSPLLFGSKHYQDPASLLGFAFSASVKCGTNPYHTT